MKKTLPEMARNKVLSLDKLSGIGRAEMRKAGEEARKREAAEEAQLNRGAWERIG